MNPRSIEQSCLYIYTCVCASHSALSCSFISSSVKASSYFYIIDSLILIFSVLFFFQSKFLRAKGTSFCTAGVIPKKFFAGYNASSCLLFDPFLDKLVKQQLKVALTAYHLNRTFLPAGTCVVLKQRLAAFLS